jgi:hypothetical protein
VGATVTIGVATGSRRKSVANISLDAVRIRVFSYSMPQRVRRLTAGCDTMFAYPASHGDPNRMKLATR